MSNTNRCTLAQLDKMTAEMVQAIPLDQHKELYEDMADRKALTDRLDAKLFAEMDRRLSQKATDARKAKGADTGTVQLVIEGEKIAADLPKNVKWDQSKLAVHLTSVIGWNTGPVTDYFDLKIPEGKFVKWPSDLQKVFEDARTVSSGKPSYKFAKAA